MPAPRATVLLEAALAPELEPVFDKAPVAPEFDPTVVAAFGLAALTCVAYVRPVVAELAPGTDLWMVKISLEKFWAYPSLAISMNVLPVSRFAP
jgi:hypothetical protein